MMNKQDEHHENDRDVSVTPQRQVATEASGKRAAVVAITAIVAIAAVALVAWLLWPSKSGKPVPAPRSVSFGESPGEQTAATGEQKLTLSPDQLQRAGLKI